MKGIILAGGSGTRLNPLTKVTSKQLLPIYDKPMVYYPLQTLIAADIKDILIISDPDNIDNFAKLLGSGKEMGIKITYEVQDKPEGLAQAFIIADNFIGDDSVTMILGDNLFVGDNGFLKNALSKFQGGALVFAKEVEDPQRFGVVTFDDKQRVLAIEEKPSKPQSNFAVTGLYVYDNSVIERAKSLKPSTRGELEITDLNIAYLQDKRLDVQIYSGYWLDTGTFDALLEASNKIASLSK